MTLTCHWTFIDRRAELIECDGDRRNCLIHLQLWSGDRECLDDVCLHERPRCLGYPLLSILRE